MSFPNYKILAYQRCDGCSDKKLSAELLRCARCKATVYCGAACQRGHWKVHKINCKPLKSGVDSGFRSPKINQLETLLRGLPLSAKDLVNFMKDSKNHPFLKADSLFRAFRDANPFMFVDNGKMATRGLNELPSLEMLQFFEALIRRQMGNKKTVHIYESCARYGLPSAGLTGVFKAELGSRVKIHISDLDPMGRLIDVKRHSAEQVLKLVQKNIKRDRSVPFLLYMWPTNSIRENIDQALQLISKKGGTVLVGGDAYGSAYVPEMDLPANINCHRFFHKGICHLVSPISDRFTGSQIRVYTSLPYEAVASLTPEGFLLENPYRPVDLSSIRLEVQTEQLDMMFLRGISEKTLPPLELSYFERLMSYYFNPKTPLEIQQRGYVMFLAPVEHIRFFLEKSCASMGMFIPGHFETLHRFLFNNPLLNSEEQATLQKWIEDLKQRCTERFPHLKL